MRLLHYPVAWLFLFYLFSQFIRGHNPGSHYELDAVPSLYWTGFEGRIISHPSFRWGNTQFVVHGRLWPQRTVQGSILVTVHDSAPMVGWGDRFVFHGSLHGPRTPAQRTYWRSQHVVRFMEVWSRAGLRAQPNTFFFSVARCTWNFRRRFETFWLDRLMPDEAALLNGMTIGSRTAMTPSFKQACIRAGIYHAVVVSGQNIALLLMAVSWLGGLFLFRKKTLFPLAVTVMIFYAAVVGQETPVLRASWMAGLAWLARALGRETPWYHGAVLSAFALAVGDITVLGSASFQLSFAATVFILATWPASPSHIARWVRVPLAAWLGVLPLLMHYFHNISIVGLLINWMLSPFFVIVFLVGFIQGLWGILSPETVFTSGIDLLQTGLHALTRWIYWTSQWRWAVLPVPPVSLGAMMGYYGIWIWFFFRRNGIRS